MPNNNSGPKSEGAKAVQAASKTADNAIIALRIRENYLGLKIVHGIGIDMYSIS